jgi:hypothetical protein
MYHALMKGMLLGNRQLVSLVVVRNAQQCGSTRTVVGSSSCCLLPLVAIGKKIRMFGSSSNSNDPQISNKNKDDEDFPFPPLIPRPTWSVESLQLHVAHPPISSHELQQLAKRAVLLLVPPCSPTAPPHNDDHDSNDTQNAQLRQDLGNMMHLIQQVVATSSVSSATTTTSQPQQDAAADAAAQAAWIYDAPRGVTTSPLRKTAAHDDENNGSNDRMHQRQEAHVWKGMLEPKTTKVGAHSYFVIPTDVTTTTKKEGK